MPSCKEVSKLLSDRLDRKLSAAEWVRLRVHLAMCSACSRVERQLHLLRKALSGLVEPRDQRRPGRK